MNALINPIFFKDDPFDILPLHKRFQKKSKEALDRSKYSKKGEKTRCEVCNKEYSLYYIKKHIKKSH